MAFTQLDPAIPVSVEGKGKGWAFACIDYGQENNLIWVTAIDETGEIWCAPNPKVRLQANWTLGRMRPKSYDAGCAFSHETDNGASADRAPVSGFALNGGGMNGST